MHGSCTHGYIGLDACTPGLVQNGSAHPHGMTYAADGTTPKKPVSGHKRLGVYQSRNRNTWMILTLQTIRGWICGSSLMIRRIPSTRKGSMGEDGTELLAHPRVTSERRNTLYTVWMTRAPTTSHGLSASARACYWYATFASADVTSQTQASPPSARRGQTVHCPSSQR